MADLLKLAKKEKLDELESAWLEAVSEEGARPAALMRVPGWLADHGHVETAETLTWYLADALRERGEVERALDAARQGARILPQSQTLRSLLADLYVQARTDRDDVEELVRRTLRNEQMSAEDALDALQNALSLHPGSYVLDPQNGNVGRVVEFDTHEAGLVVDFGDSRRSYGLGLVGRLELVDEDDFRALAAFETERLQQLADEDPEELMQLLLSTIDRRMPLRRIRLYLEPVLDSWTRWWKQARPVLERSADIGVTAGRSPSVFLRSEPLSHGDRLLRKFHRIEAPGRALAMALHLMGEARDHGHPTPRKMAEVVERVGRIGERAAGTDPQLAVGAAAVADAICSVFPDLPAPTAPREDDLRAVLNAPEALARQMRDADVMDAVLDYVRKAAPENWAAFYAGLIPAAPREICVRAERRLAAGAPQALSRACGEVMAGAEPSVGSLAWLWRVGVSRQQELPAEVNMVELAIKILARMAAIVRLADLDEQERKDQLAELRGALLVRDGAPLRQVLKAAPRARLSTIKGLTEYNSGLTDHARDTVMDILEKLEPELFVEDVPPWQEDVIYTTQAGLDKRKRELEYLVHERLPEVIKEIGEAAQFGDLSENAEYSAAIEERARLAKRIGRMQEEIGEARVITPEMASADHVTIGSRVRARNLETDEEQTFTFLGPWDADRGENIIAYNAPLGKAFMGKEPGQEVTFRLQALERRFEVLEVEPAL